MRAVVICLLSLSGCGWAFGPVGIETPSLQLPKASNAYALPLTAVSMVNYADEEALMYAVTKHCTAPVDTLPAALLKPAVVVVTPDAILWNGENVATLAEGVVAEADRRGMLVSELYDRVSNQVAQTRQAQSVCLSASAQRHAKEQLRALLVLDARIPEWTVGLILYTLGQSQITSFAYAVDDASPDRTRPAGYVGGIPGIARFGATDSHWTWATPNSEIPMTFARNVPLGKQLGQDEPRAAVLLLHDGHPMDSFAQKQDVVVGAGIHCGVPDFRWDADEYRDSDHRNPLRAPHTASTSNSEPIVTASNPSRATLTTRVPVHADQTVSAHLLLFPQIGPPGAKPTPISQADGTQCYLDWQSMSPEAGLLF